MKIGVAAMKIKNFDDAFELLIGHEGGYSNNPADPGGETMYGITKRVALANGYTGDMKLLPLSVAKDIAKKQYWDKHQCDAFDPEVGFQIFDTAYNGGNTVRWMQRAAGVPIDGMLGPATVAAVKALDVKTFSLQFNADRLDYLAGLRNLPSFAGGWMRRIAANLRESAD